MILESSFAGASQNSPKFCAPGSQRADTRKGGTVFVLELHWEITPMWVCLSGKETLGLVGVKGKPSFGGTPIWLLLRFEDAFFQTRQWCSDTAALSNSTQYSIWGHVRKWFLLSLCLGTTKFCVDVGSYLRLDSSFFWNKVQVVLVSRDASGNSLRQSRNLRS